MRLVWATDIHLNFLRGDGVQRFCQALREPDPDAVLITGDIAEADNVERFLRGLEVELDRPIYYVLGNHDYYRGSIGTVQATMAELTRTSRYLRWMPAAGVIPLTPETALMGHDGWADGRVGDFWISPDLLTDYFLIQDLVNLTDRERLARLHALGDLGADYVREKLPGALEQFAHVVFITHVPPFRESCWHKGEISDAEWLPHFTCGAMGEALMEVMERFPQRRLTVLCGHTHSAGYVKMRANLEVHTGSAEYGAPVVQKVWEIA